MKKTIWIVDDSATQRAFTQATLGDEYECEQLVDGPALFARLRDGDLPALVLLDWVMPGVSGDEVCRILRARPATRELPIVMLTAARNETSDVVRALESGANDIVAKPFEAAELRARIASIVRAHTLQQQVAVERARLTTINQLAQRLFEAGTEIASILDALGLALVASLCDGCRISLPTRDSLVLGRVDGPHDVTLAIPIRNVGEGEAVLYKHAERFEPDDLGAIQTCLDLAGLALEAAMRSNAQRATARFHEEMIGIVSHELRSPLGALSMGLELLQDDVVERRPQVLARLVRSTDRMTSIVDQLLDVTRARLGQGIPIDPTHMDLGDAAAAVVEELKLADPGLQLELTLERVAGTWDGNRIQQVLMNLVTNAIRYGKPGAPIAIDVTRRGPCGVVTVTNTNRDGAIPPDTLGSLFDPFMRGGTKLHREGLGLGLYIVAEIMRAHGGSIEVSSDPVLTTFSASLPTATFADNA